MSAPVTEVHRELAYAILFATEDGHAGPNETAQLIADSEAKAVEQANAYVESLLSAAKNAIPASEHPAEPTVQNWAWQIRNLGDDRRLVYADRDKLRAEVKESKERERVAIASWDEERQRALREGGRVVELRAERDQLRAEAQQAHITRDATCIKLKLAGACIKLAGELREARAEVEKANGYINLQVARAERAEAEVKRLGHLEAVLRSSAADMTAGNITAGGVADLRAENERLRRAYVRPDDIRAQLESANARAERAEAELATERARLDWLDSLSPGDAWGIYRSSAQQNANLHAGDPRTLRKLPGIRAAIDAAMKEEKTK